MRNTNILNSPDLLSQCQTVRDLAVLNPALSGMDAQQIRDARTQPATSFHLRQAASFMRQKLLQNRALEQCSRGAQMQLTFMRAQFLESHFTHVLA